MFLVVNEWKTDGLGDGNSVYLTMRRHCTVGERQQSKRP